MDSGSNVCSWCTMPSRVSCTSEGIYSPPSPILSPVRAADSIRKSLQCVLVGRSLSARLEDFKKVVMIRLSTFLPNWQHHSFPCFFCRGPLFYNQQSISQLWRHNCVGFRLPMTPRRSHTLARTFCMRGTAMEGTALTTSVKQNSLKKKRFRLN